MPIRDWDLYPVDWADISRAVKEAADWTCMACHRQCRRPGEKFDTQRHTLTVAHFDHVYDGPVVFLAALCTVCHLRHDAVHNARVRRRRHWQRQRQAGQLALAWAGHD